MIEMLCAKNLDHIILCSYITELEISRSILEVDNRSQENNYDPFQVLCILSQNRRTYHNRRKGHSAYFEREKIEWTDSSKMSDQDLYYIALMTG